MNLENQLSPDFVQKEFRFGLEAEFIVTDKKNAKPLWHTDLQFNKLNSIFESIPFDDIGSLDGLELERPHLKTMPFIVEGYHIPDANFNMIDILPKGVEIRTPIYNSISECLTGFRGLYERLQGACSLENYGLMTLSHHPTHSEFSGPQNKRRHDFWQWAMEVMTTYGPDVNVSIPSELYKRIDFKDFLAKVNYYAPAMAAFSVASPFINNGLWNIRGQIGKSFRTYRRSVIAPPIEIHPHEGGRLEFKVFEMSWRYQDYQNYFLLFLELLLDEELQGRASNQTRTYDLGMVAKDGLKAPEIAKRAGELLERAGKTLPAWGFDCSSLNEFQIRLEKLRVPADELIEIYTNSNFNFAVVLEYLSQIN